MIKVGFIARVEQWGLLGPAWPQPGSWDSSDGSGVQGRPAPPRPWACPFCWPQGGILRHLGGEARGMEGDEKENLSVRDWRRPSYRASLESQRTRHLSIDTQGTSTHAGTRQHRPQPRPLSVACGSVTPGLWGGAGVWGRGGQVPAPGLQSVPLSKKGVPRRYYHTGTGARQELWGLAGQGPALSPSLSGTSLSWEANCRANGTAALALRDQRKSTGLGKGGLADSGTLGPFPRRPGLPALSLGNTRGFCRSNGLGFFILYKNKLT